MVIVSPTSTGEYLVDSRKLRELTFGLADVWKIPPAADTWAISRLMRAVPAPYHGAIAIMFPRRRLAARDFVPSRVLTAADLQSLSSAELHILEALAHRFNLPTSWKHVSPDRVRDRLRTRSFQQLKSSLAAAPDAGVYEALFAKIAEDEEELRRQLTHTQSERDGYWYQFEEADDQLRRVRYDNEQLEQQLSDAKSTKKPAKGIPKELRSAVADAVLQAPTVLSALSLIEQLFADRLLVLASARKSAKDHDRFQFGGEAFALMYKLADGYWTVLAAGVPDTEARKVFGQHEFAAKEAGLTKTGQRARTFEIPGRGAMLFEPHLKIQRGPNEAESWRCHFEWLADRKQIVIGHCGVHLPK